MASDLTLNLDGLRMRLDRMASRLPEGDVAARAVDPDWSDNWDGIHGSWSSGGDDPATSPTDGEREAAQRARQENELLVERMGAKGLFTADHVAAIRQTPDAILDDSKLEPEIVRAVHHASGRTASRSEADRRQIKILDATITMPKLGELFKRERGKGSSTKPTGTEHGQSKAQLAAMILTVGGKKVWSGVKKAYEYGVLKPARYLDNHRGAMRLLYFASFWLAGPLGPALVWGIRRGAHAVTKMKAKHRAHRAAKEQALAVSGAEREDYADPYHEVGRTGPERTGPERTGPEREGPEYEGPGHGDGFGSPSDDWYGPSDPDLTPGPTSPSPLAADAPVAEGHITEPMAPTLSTEGAGHEAPSTPADLGAVPMTAAMEAPAVSPVVTPPAPVAATPAISGDATFSSAQRRWIDETKRALLEGRAVGSTGVAVSDGHETLVVKDTSDSRFVRHPGFVSHEEAIVVAQTARERMVSSVDEFAQESLGLDLGRVPEHEVVRQAFQELGVGEPTQVYAMPTPDQTLSL